MPTSSHLFYIPLVLLVGLILGVLLGRRSILVQQAEAERRKRLEEARAMRQAARAAGRVDERAESGAAAGSEAGGDGG
jgi:hypothetical protein